MTKTHQLLRLMLSGKPTTYEKIMAETGWTLVQSKKIVHYMTGSGYITHLPLAYVITQSGRDHQHVEPSRRKREKERGVPLFVAQNVNDAETTVQTAMRTQPNSVFAMGASNWSRP